MNRYLTHGEVLDCSISPLGSHRPKWNPSVYYMMREIYVDSVGGDRASMNLTDVKNKTKTAEAMRIPYEIQHIPGKGRGIVAKDFIPKHSMIWNSNDMAKFQKDQESEFNSFLSRVGYDMACDILMWAYVVPCTFEDFIKAQNNNKDNDDTCYEVAVDLGDASLMNTASKDDEFNVLWCGVGEEGKQMEKAINCNKAGDEMYARRDIQPGEEILTQYQLFSFDDKIVWFDELADKAWDNEEDSDDEDSDSDNEDEEEETWSETK